MGSKPAPIVTPLRRSFLNFLQDVTAHPSSDVTPARFNPTSRVRDGVGEMSETEFTGFLKASFGNLARHSCDGSIHYVCMDWRHMAEMLTLRTGIYTELRI